MTSTIDMLYDLSATTISPPPGSKNVRLGRAVEGPGGSWIPCATEVAEGVYYPVLFKVGRGQRQVCASDLEMRCADTALSHAIKLASYAAA